MNLSQFLAVGGYVLLAWLITLAAAVALLRRARRRDLAAMAAAESQARPRAPR